MWRRFKFAILLLLLSPAFAQQTIGPNTVIQGGQGSAGPPGPAGPPGGSLSYPGVVSDTNNGLNVTGGVATGGPVISPTIGAVRYASQWQTPAGTGNNGIANSLATGQFTVADPGYPATEKPLWTGFFPAGNAYFQLNQGVKSSDPLNAALFDQRNGVPQWFFNSPAYAPGQTNRIRSAPSISMSEYLSDSVLYPHSTTALILQGFMYDGGRNMSTPWGDKSTPNTLIVNGTSYTRAQFAGVVNISQKCFGVGDCIAHNISQQIYGGINAAQDEGLEQTRYVSGESANVFNSRIKTLSTNTDGSLAITSCVNNTDPGCTGLTTSPVTTATLTGIGTGCSGCLLIDTSKSYSTGYIASIVNAAASVPAIANANIYITGDATSNWDAQFGDTALSTTTTAAIQNSPSATTVFPLSNYSVPVASTSGIVDGQVACIFDFDWECAKVTSHTATSITFATITVSHPSGAYVFQGGLTGYAFNANADCVDPNNLLGVVPPADFGLSQKACQVYPIMFNNSGNSLSVFQGGTTMGNTGGGYGGRAYTFMGGSGGTCSVTLSGGTTGSIVSPVTVSGGTGYIDYTRPPQLILSGGSPTTPGAVYVSGISGGALTAGSIASAGAGYTSVPTCTVVTSNPYTIYPAARVEKIYDAATGTVDGVLTTDPPVGSFAVGDGISNPHYHAIHFVAAKNIMAQYNPSLASMNSGSGGMTFNGLIHGNDTAVAYANSADPTLYRGYYTANANYYTVGKGQLSTPYGITFTGPWSSGLYMTQPPFGGVLDSGVVLVRCWLSGCADSAYNVITLQNGGGWDTMTYTPSNRNWTWSGGGNMSLSPTGNFSVTTPANVNFIANNPTQNGIFASFLCGTTPCSSWTGQIILFQSQNYLNNGGQLGRITYFPANGRMAIGTGANASLNMYDTPSGSIGVNLCYTTTCFTIGTSNFVLPNGQSISNTGNYSQITIDVASSGTTPVALGTTAIAAGACAPVITASAIGLINVNDVVSWTFSGAPDPAYTTGGLRVVTYVVANSANFVVCNSTAASVTPGATSINWRVAR